MLKRIVNKWLSWSDDPYLKVYRGIGSEKIVLIHGQLFKGLSLEREKPSKRVFRNALEMLKRFVISPWPERRVSIELDGKTYFTETDETGYFSIEIQQSLSAGWNEFTVVFGTGDDRVQKNGEVFIDDIKNALISDIDDTILVSHATSPLKKLYLLITRNHEQRKPFEGIAASYCEMAEKNVNFFYVSSSEWNLYDFILSFCEHHNFPKGVFFLQDIKRWKELIKSGGGDHQHKEDKIRFLLHLFPNMKVHLVGDSGQKDIFIYQRIAEAFPKQVRSVHIRDVRKKNRKNTQKQFEKFPEGIKTELFSDRPNFIME